MTSLLKVYASLIVLIACLQLSTSQRAACGPTLDAVLSTICVHGFNTKFKRTGLNDWDDSDSTELDSGLPFPYANFPFLTKIHGDQIDTLAKTRRRREGGVYDECCGKGCTYNEILSYCNKFKV